MTTATIVTIQNTYYDETYKCFMRQVAISHRGNLHCRVMGSQKKLHELKAEFGAFTLVREKQPYWWR